MRWLATALGWAGGRVRGEGGIAPPFRAPESGGKPPHSKVEAFSRLRARAARGRAEHWAQFVGFGGVTHGFVEADQAARVEVEQ